jgi:hypothetical protein
VQDETAVLPLAPDIALDFFDPYLGPEGSLHLDLRKVVSVAQVRRTRAKAETRP